MPGMWGYVQGGMGMVSFYFCDAARESGAIGGVGCPSGADCAGRRRAARKRRAHCSATIVSNADPRQTLRCWAVVQMPPGAEGSSRPRSRAAP